MLYFVDESGIDLKKAPYAVLACVGVEEPALWPFAQEFLGLKENVGFEELTALAQAKLAFVDRALDLASKFGMTVFASIVPRNAPQQRDDRFLRKDFAYMFQRIHCPICDGPPHSHGVLIFDEQDKALSQSLLDQIHKYFVETDRGKQRAERMIPMPFFVHSGLTPAIQLADIVAYVINWGLRMPRMPEPSRAELKPFADKVFQLRYQGMEVPRERDALRSKRTWGIAYIEDLETARRVAVG